MDVRKIFRKIAAKLSADFDISAEVHHNGSKGAIRENVFRTFLDQRLPGLYATGSGEIVGPRNDTSLQCDLILYDRLRGVPLVYDDVTQVYPIECVYGTIEVKSHLSKDKLIEGLEQIRSVKELAPEEQAVFSPMPGVTSSSARPRPFGMLFAYKLGDNSLKSLVANIREWEESVPHQYWPNLVVVLHEGLIYHANSIGRALFLNDLIRKDTRPTYLAYGEDALFHAYAAILDMAGSAQLTPPIIRRYYDLPKVLGGYSVKNHDRFVRPDTRTPRRLTANFIERIIAWCADKPKMTYKDVLLRQLGQLPGGLDEQDLQQMAHFYDPENLPGFHEIAEPIDYTSGRPVTRVRMQIPPHWIEVNGEVYHFSSAYITADDLEDIPER